MKKNYKSIDLTCKSCGGTREIDKKNKVIVCPYCGSKEQLIDVDRFGDNEQKNTQKKVPNAADIEKFKKGKLSKIILIFFVIALFFAIIAFASNYRAAGIAAIIQAIVFVLAWLSGMGILKRINQSVYRLFAIVGFVMIIVVIALFGISPDTNKHVRFDWPTTGLATMIPDPGLEYGRIYTNNGEEFSIDLYKCSEEDYLIYVEQCKDMGFTVDEKTENTSYRAYTEDGYALDLFFYSSMDEMSIDLKAPVSMREIKWSDIDAFAVLPAPKSNQGKIVYEYEFSAYVYVGDTTRTDYDEYVQACKDAGFSGDMMRGDDYYYAYRGNQYLSLEYLGYNMMSISVSGEYDKSELSVEETTDVEAVDDTKSLTAESETDTTAEATDTDVTEATENPISKAIGEAQNGDVSPDFKETMDNYEAFIDDYVAFLEKYENSDDVSGMLTEYTTYVAKFTTVMSELDAISEEELSDADALYFTEVSTRIYQKLMGAM